jgi:hypothetical protein
MAGQMPEDLHCSSATCGFSSDGPLLNVFGGLFDWNAAVLVLLLAQTPSGSK